MSKIRILLTGGGSGGHIYPLIAVWEALQKETEKLNLEPEFFYMGPKDEWSKVFEGRGVKIIYIISGKIRRYFSFLNFLDFFKILFSFLSALIKMLFIMPDVIFSKGGPGALPVVFAGWFYRIPVIIHESDAFPGLTNLLSARFSKRIALGFEEAKKYFPLSKTAVVGNPIRFEILSQKIDSKIAKQNLGFNPDFPLMLVVGGSQGAQKINELILISLEKLLPITQVLHQTGEANFLEVQKLSRAAILSLPVEVEKKSRYEAVPFLNNEKIGLALSAADLIVSRAGAGSIFEIAAFEKPSIIIPIFESANDHQRLNAYAYANTGAAVVIEEDNLLSSIFLNQVKLILTDKNIYQKMTEAAKKFSKTEAAQIIALEIIRLASK
ncbi:MAG: UDP-N-acetylglucosamine--N-acetylmuramyl-(pentapeptide) pyrophosphoryl-undecaprenol N-acetylglucosamine transferase [Minisyncoccia bacterium]